MFGLKLLSFIVERNPGFVSILKKLKLIPILLDYFQVSHSKFNSFTVKIVRSIVQSREVDLDELLKFDIMTHINQIMTTVMSQSQDWCTDDLLDIILEILKQAADVINTDQSAKKPQEVFNSLIMNFKAFQKLLSSSDPNIVEKAAQNILGFIHFSSKYLFVYKQ